MKDWMVEFVGEAREVFAVSAETAEEAVKNAMTHGESIVLEASSMEFYSVKEEV